MPSVDKDKQYCTHCGRKLPMSEFYSNQNYIRHVCKTCYKMRVNDSRRKHQCNRRVKKMRLKPDFDGSRYCLKCGSLKLVSEFYKRNDGSYSSYCKDCDRAISKAYYRALKSTKEGREKLLLYQAKFRDVHREELKEANRIRRRKAGVAPRHRVNKDKILKMYGEGVPVADIARECCSTEHSVRNFASNSGIHRVRSNMAKVCSNCWLYPCFKGIENFTTNFALTCRSWKLK